MATEPGFRSRLVPTSQIHSRDIVITNTDNSCDQQSAMGILSTSTTSRTLVPTKINLRHGEHHPQNKFFVVRTTVQYPLDNFFKSKLPAVTDDT